MRNTTIVTTTIALLFSASSAFAEESGQWDYRALIYLWAPALGGTTTTGQDVELSFSDVVENLDFGLMGALEANRGPVSFLGDFQYLDLANGQNASVGPGIPVAVDADVSGFVFTGSVGYDFQHQRDSQLVAFGGLRYLGLDTTANLSVAGGSRRISGDISNIDAIAGVRGSQRLSEKWAFSYNADVGVGDSDLTWHVAATFDYRINNWDLSFGYRHMEWDLGNSSNVLSDLSFSGPIVGAKIAF